jgi:SAM-dependent methyltransferase
VPFRARFDCLWCGARHLTRSPQDLEGWASLCPTCIGRAGDNGFLRTRLRAALAERSRATEGLAGPVADTSEGPTGPVADASHARGDGADPSEAAGSGADDFYQRSGRFSAGAIQDAAWLMELDAVTAWLDALRLGPVVVELGAGGGWWSPLLAADAELWAYDPDDAALERLRQRLVAHGLRAHLHRRRIDEPPDRTVDAVFAAFALGSTPDDAALDRRLEAVAGWLRPGGRFAFIEAVPTPSGEPVDGPSGPLRALGQAALRDRLQRHGLLVGTWAPAGRSLVAGVAALVGSEGDPGSEPAPVPVATTR